MEFVEKARIMDGSRINRALARLASEVVEENHGTGDLWLVGIRRRGVPLAERMADKIADLEGTRPPVGILDITLYRDDLSTVGAKHDLQEVTATQLPDGRLVMIARPEGDISWSSDTGQTWTPPVTFGMRMFAPSLFVLRDGTLTTSERDSISAVAPTPLKQRFANVKPATPLCPPQPWWAFWRGF